MAFGGILEELCESGRERAGPSDPTDPRPPTGFSEVY